MDSIEVIAEEAVEAIPESTSTVKCIPKMDCSKVVVKASQYGDGVFAAVPMREGEIVEYGLARRLTNVNGHENPYIFTWSEDRTAWALCSGAATFYNTSSNPNCRCVRYFDEDRFEIVALRDVAEGEELTHQYKSLSWRECFLKINDDLE